MTAVRDGDSPAMIRQRPQTWGWFALAILPIAAMLLLVSRQGLALLDSFVAAPETAVLVPGITLEPDPPSADRLIVTSIRSDSQAAQRGIAVGDSVVAIARNGWDEAIAKDIDVIIDFSSPAGLMDALDWCVSNKTALVSGTTGLSAKEKGELRAAAKKIPYKQELLSNTPCIGFWGDTNSCRPFFRCSGTAPVLQNKKYAHHR